MACYLICFDRPLQHARHYVGYTNDTAHDTQEAVDSRVRYHLAGRGSRLMKAVAAAGIGVQVVRIWPGASQSFERRLKGHSSTRNCPRCSGPAALKRAKLP